MKMNIVVVLMLVSWSSCEIKISAWRKYYRGYPNDHLGVTNEVNDFLKSYPCIRLIQAGSSDAMDDHGWSTHFWILYDDFVCDDKQEHVQLLCPCN